MGSKQMSRSRKKTSVSKGRCKNSRWAKHAANKRVRRAKTLWGKSKAFRKISETWDICDWKFYRERSWNPNREEKKINGKNAITENNLEEMHEAMDEL